MIQLRGSFLKLPRRDIELLGWSLRLYDRHCSYHRDHNHGMLMLLSKKLDLLSQVHKAV